MKNKKIILIILIIAAAIILIQKLDFDLILKKELDQENVNQELNNLKVIFFDVGQGDSIFIQTPQQKQILIDGGPDGTILTKLKEYMGADKQIDLVILTHPHADHVSGLLEVLKNYQVNQIWLTGVLHTSNTYLEFLNLIKQKNIPAKLIFACGNTHQEGCSDLIEIEPDVNFKVLSPLENLNQKKIDNLNNSSIVLKLTYQDNSFLLAADAETPVEEQILKTFALYELKADVLKVGHQGSSDASSQEFLEAIQPQQAIISVGQDNSYGHPSLRVIRRLERMNIEIFRTDENGDIVIIK